jgi:1-acyl-sn-glycerol-3-phosphate acyltransferase
MHLSPDQLATLTRRERLALRLGKLVNESARAKGVARWFSETVTSRWMTLVSERRMVLVGLDELAKLQPDRGVVLAANHRSFFDMYMVLTYLHKRVSFCERVFFPVRSSFWYDHFAGMAINAACSTLAMYPPVFRETEKREITRAGLDFLAEQLQHPGTVVGIHPEGTRGKGPDPYELLPAEQGFGRVVLGGAQLPIVIPIFVNGMGSNLYAECRSTFDGTGIPIIMVFGKPMDLSSFAGADPQRLRSQIDVGRRTLDEIRKLSEIERRIRDELASGERRHEGHEAPIV